MFVVYRTIIIIDCYAYTCTRRLYDQCRQCLRLESVVTGFHRFCNCSLLQVLVVGGEGQIEDRILL